MTLRLRSLQASRQGDCAVPPMPTDHRGREMRNGADVAAPSKPVARHLAGRPRDPHDAVAAWRLE